MRHAIRRLEEEARALEEGLALLRADPGGGAGAMAEAEALAAELLQEIEEVNAALAVLRREEARRAPTLQVVRAAA